MIKTLDEVRRAGLEALSRELGLVDMIRFLQLFNSGHGDYSVERHQWIDQLSADDLKARFLRKCQDHEHNGDSCNDA